MTQPSLNYVNCPDASGGHRMAYWQWGQSDAGHLVVCAHGLSRQGRDFDVLAAALVEAGAGLPGGMRVVCPDVAGRGESDWLKDPMAYQVPLYAADMMALLNHLHAEAPVKTLDWVGTSMGGLIGIVVAGMPRPIDQAQGVGEPAASAGPPQARPAPSGGSALHEVKSVGAPAIHRLVLNDVGPAIEWQAIVRIGMYLGQSGEFGSVQDAADVMWKISTGFGPHTPQQWLALSQYMVKPVSSEPGSKFRMHYDPAMAVPFKQATEEATKQGEAMLWHLYDSIKAETLLLRGANSDLLSPETARAMTQRGPKARLVEFAGVGHAPTLIADDQVKEVKDFLLA
jgi:pimeloyl-ACP methyl ester carboxylesterase